MIRNLLKNSAVFKSSKSFFQGKQYSLTTVQLKAQATKEVADFQSLKNREDLQKLAEEESHALRSQSRLYFLQWQDNKKVVYEANVPQYNALRWQILASVLGGAFLYMLYQGDSKYKYIVAVPLLAVLSARRGNLNAVRNATPYLKEVSLHKDGKTVNCVLSQQGHQVNLENIPISSIKLHSGANVSRQVEQKSFSFNQVRLTGVATDGYLVSIGEQDCVAPYDHVSNKFALDSIWQGKNVDVNNI